MPPGSAGDSPSFLVESRFVHRRSAHNGCQRPQLHAPRLRQSPHGRGLVRLHPRSSRRRPIPAAHLGHTSETRSASRPVAGWTSTQSMCAESAEAATGATRGRTRSGWCPASRRAPRRTARGCRRGRSTCPSPLPLLSREPRYPPCRVSRVFGRPWGLAKWSAHCQCRTRRARSANSSSAVITSSERHTTSRLRSRPCSFLDVTTPASLS